MLGFTPAVPETLDVPADELAAVVLDAELETADVAAVVLVVAPWLLASRKTSIRVKRIW